MRECGGCYSIEFRIEINTPSSGLRVHSASTELARISPSVQMSGCDFAPAQNSVRKILKKNGLGESYGDVTRDYRVVSNGA